MSAVVGTVVTVLTALSAGVVAVVGFDSVVTVVGAVVLSAHTDIIICHNSVKCNSSIAQNINKNAHNLRTELL